MRRCFNWKLPQKTFLGVLAASLTIFLTMDFLQIQIRVSSRYRRFEPADLNSNILLWKGPNKAPVFLNATQNETQTIQVGKHRRYRVQHTQKEKEVSEFNLAQMDLIEAANKDKLPGRVIRGNGEDLCAVTMKDNITSICIPPFLRLETRIRVAPKYNLLTCIIQKSMSTVMTAIFCYLYNEHNFLAAGREFAKECTPVRFCQRKNEYAAVFKARQKYAISDQTQHDWLFTMITRDPVDRFLSGYVDKCIRAPRGRGTCNGCGRNMTCFILTEYERMQNQLAKGKLVRSFEDRHFFPQNWRCDLNTEYANFKFLRYSSDPATTLLEDLIPVLRKQKVPQSSIDYIRAELTKGRTVHSTVQSEARQFFENRLRNSPFLMEYIIRMFYHDYRLLNYPLPKGF